MATSVVQGQHRGDSRGVHSLQERAGHHVEASVDGLGVHGWKDQRRGPAGASGGACGYMNVAAIMNVVRYLTCSQAH
jgi:hypothetical protein